MHTSFWINFGRVYTQISDFVQPLFIVYVFVVTLKNEKTLDEIKKKLKA